MPKKKSSPHQPSLFRREVPQMPEGYYSSGPNPNLRRFVEQHATPYDPETDGYNVPPFDKPITTTKATAIYNMHTYWSKKPHDAIREYIKHYTKPGDLVLDPFCGSGGTALAALMEGRAAISIDLSPAATFITKNYCTPVLEGVPPHERDKPENAASLADWIRQCRRTGLFELGRVLYEKGGLRFDELSEEHQLQVEEDYQICVGRSEKMKKGERAKRKRKAAQPLLFPEDEP